MHLLPRTTKNFQLDHKQEIVLLGSCFSTHLNDQFARAGFSVLSNPFGVVFHPNVLAKFIDDCLNPSEERLFEMEDVWLSWDAGSEVYGMSEEALKSTISAIRSNFTQTLSRAQLVVITLGTAHGYRLKETNEYVGNCHKSIPDLFQKELTDIAEMKQQWSNTLNAMMNRFPHIKFIFTVSPVRYSRDGWVENNRSKARLFELIGQLQTDFQIDYFPAYELVNDILRDYRFFEEDGVHPNSLAIREVWKLFRSWYFSKETNAIINELEELRKMQEHRMLFPESIKAQNFLTLFQQKRESFLSLHPFIRW